MCFADKPLTICDLSVIAPTVSDSQANQVESRDNISSQTFCSQLSEQKSEPSSEITALTALDWGQRQDWGFNFYKVKGRLCQAIMVLYESI